MKMDELLLRVLLGLVVFASSAAQQDSNYRFAKAGEFKFIAAVTSKAGICTATILDNYWIMTAAHCFYYRDTIIGEKDAKVLVGLINYELPRSNSKYETMSAKIVVHPHFWLNRLAKFDVALVRLRDKLDFDEYIDKIQIAGDEWPQSENQTADCMSLGFGGFRSTAPLTKDLKVWNVTAAHGVDTCICARSFQYKRLVCVKELEYSLLCKGDDGGPLICGDVVRAIGHMVWNRGCEHPTYPTEKCSGNPNNDITSYTFLCPLNDWIREYIPEVPPKPKSCDASRERWTFTNLAVYLFVMLFFLC